MQGLSQHFWRRWQFEYLHLLQARNKWSKVSDSIKLGSLVLLHDPQTPPMAWKLARVTQIFPGSDGHVRVAEVKTATGTYRRPTVKLHPLPQDDS